ncbi:MAG: PDZ domain-containing protein, partial [Candidatus Omnitrophica bacterium]|nr:PDZ domain-containing protein [Candidatus Omnitrophota bacterium]MBD3269580.1 PDZ domain-containing protein [Candidatus Omnitrophota bacterium]
MKKRHISLSLVLLLFIFAITLGYSWGRNENREDMYRELEIFTEGLATVETKYVEDKTAEDLIYGAMSGMLSSLDSYSQFLNPDDYKNLLVETEGKFGGLGIEITVRNGVLTIISPIEDTPAWEAGIKPGDIIIKIDGEFTKGVTLNEAVKRLRGEPGTEVTLTVLREKSKTMEEITIVRGVIKIKDIKQVSVLEENVGYIKITEFRETTAQDLDKALRDLKDKGMEALIIDVRNNP